LTRRISIRTASQTLRQRHSASNSSKSTRRSNRRLFKKLRIRFIRYGILSANVALLAAVVFFVTNNPDTDTNARQSLAASASGATEISPLDQLSSADIAVHAARLTALPEATAITNQADSEATQLAITATENKIVAKPQVVGTTLKSAKDITTYTTVNGDTIAALAAKFGISSDSIRWSNALTSEKIPAGKQLLIPPVSGIVYTVKSGDTADNLASRYSSTKDQILSDNDAEVGGLKVGQRILIRGGVQPVVRAAVTSYAASSIRGGRASYGYNGYDYGYCTWYVANKRLAAGAPMPTNLGNAATWGTRAAAYGLRTGRTPAPGAAVVTSTSGAGHVAYVEVVNADGSVWISEMNSRGQVSMTDTTSTGGWGRVDWKLIPASKANIYTYVY
jgi:surface antigen